MPQKPEKIMWTDISFVLQKNGGYTPSSLDGRLFVVVGLAGWLACYPSRTNMPFGPVGSK